MAESLPTEFKRFPDLPVEIRREIWHYTPTRRLVHISSVTPNRWKERVEKWENEHGGINPTSPKPCIPRLPSTLCVNAESRSALYPLYQKLWDEEVGPGLPSLLTCAFIRPVLYNPDFDILYIDDANKITLLHKTTIGDCKYLAVQGPVEVTDTPAQFDIAFYLKQVFPLAHKLEALYFVQSVHVDPGNIDDVKAWHDQKSAIETTIWNCWHVPPGGPRARPQSVRRLQRDDEKQRRMIEEEKLESWRSIVETIPYNEFYHKFRGYTGFDG